MILIPVAFAFGTFFLLVGILGFNSWSAPDHMLLGLFHVNTALNIVHLLSGIVALACGFAGFSAARLYFRIFGIFYGVVAILGFIQSGTPLFGLLSSNMANGCLHLTIVSVFLALGFAPKRYAARRPGVI